MQDIEGRFTVKASPTTTATSTTSTTTTTHSINTTTTTPSITTTTTLTSQAANIEQCSLLFLVMSSLVFYLY